MGMSIDEAIKKLSQSAIVIGCEDWMEARDLALETMRKYQKIEQIVSDFRKYQKGITWGFGGEKYMQMVSEVVEDGTN